MHQPQPGLLLLQTDSEQRQRPSSVELLQIKTRPMPAPGIFNGDDSSGEPSSCSGPQTLQGEATNPVETLENGVLPPSSLGFVTRSTLMLVLLPQDK